MRKIKEQIKLYKIELFQITYLVVSLGLFISMLTIFGIDWVAIVGIILASLGIGMDIALIYSRHIKSVIDIEAANILRDKFEVYTIDDDEGNIYYCLDLNSENCFIEITKTEYYKLCVFQGKTIDE